MIVLALIPAVLGVLVGWGGFLGWREKLPRSRGAGVRTEATMRSDEAFRVANRVAGLPTMIAGGVGVFSSAAALAMPDTLCVAVSAGCVAVSAGCVAVSAGCEAPSVPNLQRCISHSWPGKLHQPRQTSTSPETDTEAGEARPAKPHTGSVPIAGTRPNDRPPQTLASPCPQQ